MNIEIVSHCWHYSRLLNYQLSSLIEFPPQEHHVTMSVFFTKEDDTTYRVIEFFRQLATGPTLRIEPRELPRRKLMRRAVGRNIAALETVADWIWFTDCDFCFGPGALDSIPRAVDAITSPLCFPARLGMSPTHAVGDALIQALATLPAFVPLPIDQFRFRPIGRAFGGVQIVRGAVAREKGYLRDTAHVAKESNSWQRTYSDKYFRRSLGTRGVPVPIPHIYRIRHSQAGRFHPDVQN